MFSRTSNIASMLFLLSSLLPAAALSKSQEQGRKMKDTPSEDAMQETIRVLDADGSGKVERSEIETFAASAGLSMQEIQEDFAELDRNGDGALDATEITGVMALMDNAVSPTALETVEANPEESKAAEAEEKQEEQTTAVEDEKQEEQIGTEEEEASDSQPLPARVELPTFPTHEVKAADVKLTRLSHEAESRAARTLAEAIARRAEELLQRGAEDAKAAAKYEALAQSLRANATAALRGAAVRTKGAARDASEKVVTSAMPEVRHLQTTATSLEKQAQDHWSQARVAMERVMHHR